MVLTSTIKNRLTLEAAFPARMFDTRIWQERDGIYNFNPDLGPLRGGKMKVNVTSANPAKVTYDFAHQRLKLDIFILHLKCFQPFPEYVSTEFGTEEMIGNPPKRVVFDSI